MKGNFGAKKCGQKPICVKSIAWYFKTLKLLQAQPYNYGEVFFATTQRIPRKRLEARVPTQPTTCMVTNLQLLPLG